MITPVILHKSSMHRYVIQLGKIVVRLFVGPTFRWWTDESNQPIKLTEEEREALEKVTKAIKAKMPRTEAWEDAFDEHYPTTRFDSDLAEAFELGYKAALKDAFKDEIGYSRQHSSPVPGSDGSENGAKDRKKSNGKVGTL